MKIPKLWTDIPFEVFFSALLSHFSSCMWFNKVLSLARLLCSTFFLLCCFLCAPIYWVNLCLHSKARLQIPFMLNIDMNYDHRKHQFFSPRLLFVFFASPWWPKRKNKSEWNAFHGSDQNVLLSFFSLSLTVCDIKSKTQIGHSKLWKLELSPKRKQKARKICWNQFVFLFKQQFVSSLPCFIPYSLFSFKFPKGIIININWSLYKHKL